MVMLCDKIDKNTLSSFVSLSNGQWVAEEKYDGDRVRCRVEKGVFTLHNKKGLDITFRYPDLKGRFSSSSSMFLDGEMCVLNDKGVSVFNEGIAFRTHCKDPQKIQEASELYPVTYVVFDLLELNGKDLRACPWTERRKLLESIQLLPNMSLSNVNYDICDEWDRVTKLGGEGIILKNKFSGYYENKRSLAWKKVKDIKEVDLTFTKYEPHKDVNGRDTGTGITLENSDGIRCSCAGEQHKEVLSKLQSEGKVIVTIRHLGWTGQKYRQPTFMKLVEVN